MPAVTPRLLPIVIEEMRAWSPDVLVSSSNRTHIALSSVIRDVPIVVVAAIDPIRIGLSDSLAYPSRNFTGSVGFIEGLMHKRMEVLKAAMPGARKVALHLDPNNPAFPPTHDDTVQAAGRLGIEVVVAGYSHRNEVVPALDAAKRQGADAVIVLPDGIAISQMGAIAQRSTELGLPTIGFNDTELSLGLTFIVGADRTQLWRDAAATTSKILRGTPINKIPFQQPTKIYIGVNLRSAKKFGLDIPLSLLARADDVLE